MVNFYILSTGRCGTSFIAKILEKKLHKEYSLHQSKSSKVINLFGNLSLQFPRFKCSVIRYLERASNNYLPNSTVDPLKTIPLLFYFHEKPPLKDTTISFIHIIRDPRNFVTSFMNWKNRKMSGLVAHHLLPFWMPPAYLDANTRLYQFMMMSKFEHFSWVWNYKNSLIKEEFEHRNNYYLFRYEDIFSDQNEFQRLLNMCGIRENIDDLKLSEKVNKSQKNSFPHWNNWTRTQAKQLDNHCGELMQKYGYGHEKEWKGKLAN